MTAGYPKLHAHWYGKVLRSGTPALCALAKFLNRSATRQLDSRAIEANTKSLPLWPPWNR